MTTSRWWRTSRLHTKHCHKTLLLYVGFQMHATSIQGDTEFENLIYSLVTKEPTNHSLSLHPQASH